LPLYGFNNLGILHVLKAALAKWTYEVCLTRLVEDEPSTSFCTCIEDIVLLVIQSFFKIPQKRVVEEGVGHIGIVKVEGKDSEKKVFMIHASGTKNSGGRVKKALLLDYLAAMPFVGVKVTRFE